MRDLKHRVFIVLAVLSIGLAQASFAESNNNGGSNNNNNNNGVNDLIRSQDRARNQERRDADRRAQEERNQRIAEQGRQLRQQGAALAARAAELNRQIKAKEAEIKAKQKEAKSEIAKLAESLKNFTGGDAKSTPEEEKKAPLQTVARNLFSYVKTNIRKDKLPEKDPTDKIGIKAQAQELMVQARGFLSFGRPARSYGEKPDKVLKPKAPLPALNPDEQEAINVNRKADLEGLKTGFASSLAAWFTIPTQAAEQETSMAAKVDMMKPLEACYQDDTRKLIGEKKLICPGV